MRRLINVLKGIFIVLAVIMVSLCNSTQNCNAQQIDDVEIWSIDNQNSERTMQQIGELLHNEIQSQKEVQVGEHFFVYNVQSNDGYFVYPIYVDYEYRYVAQVSPAGDVTITDNLDIADKVQSLSSGKYILYVDNGVLYAENQADHILLIQYMKQENVENSEFAIKTFEEKEAYLKTLYSLDTVKYVDITAVQFIELNNLAGKSRSVITGADGNCITHKCNITNFVNQGNYGLCWSAAAATITNYKTGSNIDAKYFADKYHIDYNTGATVNQIRACLVGMGLSYDINSNKISWSQIKNNINADKPFIVILRNSQSAHAITGYGYGCLARDTASGVRTIYAWDSNGYKISFLDNASTAITTSGKIWQWSETVY